MEKPFSQACENNKHPILMHLKTAFAEAENVLEIGSGTGQHAVYFAPNLAHLDWQTADLPVNHAGIKQWLSEYPSPNLKSPLSLDLAKPWPIGIVDAIYTANTLHIVSAELVEQFFHGVKQHLTSKGTLVVYGPFNYDGQFTSQSNAEFDQFLKARNPSSGIRDFEWINKLASHAELTLIDDHAMPANNRLLVFKRQ